MNITYYLDGIGSHEAPYDPTKPPDLDRFIQIVASVIHRTFFWSAVLPFVAQLMMLINVVGWRNRHTLAYFCVFVVFVCTAGLHLVTF